MFNVVRHKAWKTTSYINLIYKQHFDVNKLGIRYKHSWSNPFAQEKYKKLDGVPKTYRLIYKSDTPNTIKALYHGSQVSLIAFLVAGFCMYKFPEDVDNVFDIENIKPVTNPEKIIFLVSSLVFSIIVMKTCKMYTLRIYKDHKTGLYRALLPGNLPQKLKVVDFSKESLKPKYKDSILNLIPWTASVLDVNNKTAIIMLPQYFDSDEDYNLLFDQHKTQDK